MGCRRKKKPGRPGEDRASKGCMCTRRVAGFAIVVLFGAGRKLV
jgi:hypothetical protein